MSRNSVCSARIGVRIAPEALATIKLAAELLGRSVSEFMASAAQEAANRTIGEMRTIRLSAEGQRAFAEALLTPAKPTPGLRRAFEAHRRLIGDVRQNSGE
jgi:uncharacterized protein (DUF1778 family)